MPTENKVDFGQLISKQKNRITIEPAETPSERKHRLALEAAGARFERTKDVIVLIAVLLGVGLVLALCLWLAAGSNSSPEDKKWATAILASIVTLGMGYLVGKNQASK
jgi:hypothetical protein